MKLSIVCLSCKTEITAPCGHQGFNKPEQAEGMLNSLALEGWRVVGCMTQAVSSFSWAGFTPSGVLVLQRPVKLLA